MKIQYYKDAKHNYLILGAEIKEENLFHYRMLENNEIDGLLPFSLRNMDGCYNLYYEMDKKQSIKNKYSRNKMNHENLRALFNGFLQTAKTLEDYLLDSSHIVLSPETVFEEFSSGRFYFVYDPGYENSLNQSFLEELLEYVDLEDTKAQELIYKILDSSCDENGLDFNYLENLITSSEEYNASQEIGAFVTHNNSTEDNYYEKDYVDDEDNEDQAEAVINKKKITIKLPFEGSFLMSVLFAIVAGVLWYLRYAYILTYEENLLDIAVFMVAIMMSLTSFLITLRKNDSFFLRNRQNRKIKDDEIAEVKEQDENIDKAESKDHQAKIEPVQWSEAYDEDEETVMLSLNFGENVHKLYPIEGTDHESISLRKLPCVIGKLSTCSDIVIKDKTISRMHARIYKPESGSDEVCIQDLNSTNGTYINGRRLMPNEKAQIRIDDEISFGKCIFAYR